MALILHFPSSLKDKMRCTLFFYRFDSHPCDANLKIVVTEAGKQDKRTESLSRIIDYYERQNKLTDNENALYVKVLLLAGNLDKAWEMVKDAKSLGWFFGSATGLVFGSVTAVAAGFDGMGSGLRYCTFVEIMDLDQMVNGHCNGISPKLQDWSVGSLSS